MNFLASEKILFLTAIVLLAKNSVLGFNNFTSTNVTAPKENKTEVQQDREFVFCKFSFVMYDDSSLDSEKVMCLMA